MQSNKDIKRELTPLRKQLTDHSLYKALNDIDDIKHFMETHVYAVWDFMSLIKHLQTQLTCVKTPWTPTKNSKITRFINDIVLAEESDFNELGEIKSHFEMYTDAMEQIGASTSKINSLIVEIQLGINVGDVISNLNLPKPIYNFLKFTFDVISTNENHKVAAAFTFGREDLIPDMFFKIIDKTGAKSTYNKLTYYLQRHIDIDGDEHGPMALEMINELCENDPIKIQEVIQTSKEALDLRIKLWDYIEQQITNKKIDSKSKTLAN
jgi:hypothetical protein